MRNISILPETLKNFDYYKNKLPLFLQNSNGFVGQFKIWYDILTGDNHDGLADKCDSILYLLNIFDGDYLTFIASLDGSGAEDDPPYGTKSDILDNLGELFSISRTFSCTYKNSNGQIVTENISLNNEDFLIFIKCKIIRNFCNGSYEQIQGYYDAAGMNVFMKNDEDSASVKLYLLSFPDTVYSDNIKKMFLAGLLKIDAMGVNYSFIAADIGDIFRWDGLGVNEVWDIGVWAE